MHQTLSSKERQNQAYDDADDDAGDDREIKTGMAALNANISWQTSKPSATHACPQRRADEHSDKADDDEQFPEFLHLANSPQVSRGQNFCGPPMR